jgi:2-oxoisovalerate dehydrogenase E1 component
VAGNICDRAKAFDVVCSEVESNDVIALFSEFESAFAYVRNEKKPFCQVVKTYRLGPHSKGDDFRDIDEIEKHRKKDPLKLAEKHISTGEIAAIYEKIEKEVSESLASAISGTPEASETIYNGICEIETSRATDELPYNVPSRFFESINNALHYIFDTYPEAIIVGEDINDPYGGSFKVTKGLSAKFPQRVFSSPISEAAIAGIAGGLALNKMRPIVEVMFGDFVTLMYDQIINHQAKFRWMYNNQVAAPVLYRMPTGGKRGYGPTHSQSLEKIFFGIPNITVIAPTPHHNSGQLLLNAFLHMTSPVIFIENKAFYAEKLMVENEQKQGDFYAKSSDALFPTLRLAPSRDAAEASIICYGGGIETALAAAWRLMIDEEINTEVVCPSLISPLPFDEIYAFVSDTSKHIVVIDEEYAHFGWSAEVVLSVLREDNKRGIKRSADNLGMKKTFISSSKAVEDSIYPSKDEIARNIISHTPPFLYKPTAL